jgi:hypothetical protein
MTGAAPGRCTRAVVNVNLAGFRHSWTTWLLEQSKEILKVYRGLAAEIYTYMVHETPQYTGESVSNWTLAGAHPVYSSSGSMKAAYEASAPRGLRTPWNKASGGGAGSNPAAVEMALGNLHDGLSSVRSVAEPIYIANATRWDASSDVSKIIEGEPHWLRAVNSRSTFPEQAASFVKDIYSGVLTEQQLGHLMRMAT